MRPEDATDFIDRLARRFVEFLGFKRADEYRTTAWGDEQTCPAGPAGPTQDVRVKLVAVNLAVPQPMRLVLEETTAAGPLGGTFQIRYGNGTRTRIVNGLPPGNYPVSGVLFEVWMITIAAQPWRGSAFLVPDGGSVLT